MKVFKIGKVANIMKKYKIAIISDIHGNSWALKEILKDIKANGITIIINLGDSLYGPLDPKGTFELLIDNTIISISGNQDRIILENLDSKSDIETLEYVKTQIDNKTIDWLKSLPFDYIFENEIYCCHASPKSDTTYLLEKLHPDCVSISSNIEIDKKLESIRQKIVLCGHSHVPRIVETLNKTVINSGSVGLPAYDDDFPILHKMESFNNYAKYSILTKIENTIKIEQVSVPYDFEKAATIAKSNNRSDWDRWIRTGKA